MCLALGLWVSGVYAQVPGRGRGVTPQQKKPAQVNGTKPGGLYPVDPNNIPRRGIMQQDQYTKLSYGFPSKPRDKWAAGIKTGINFFHGDVLNKTQWNVGAELSKAVGHAMSLRSIFVVGRLGGQNKEQNTVLASSIDNLMGYNGVTVWNFQTTYYYLSLQAVLNLNNISFYQEEPKLRILAFIGPAFMNYTVRSNMLDAGNQVYDYSGGINGVNQDDTYETIMDKDSSKNSSVRPVPILTVGFGISYRLTKRFEVGLEYTFHNEMLFKNDLWDGRRFQETVNVLSTDYDGFSSVQATALYNFGKGVDPLTWMNPLEIEYEQVLEMKKKLKELLVDTDNDGVADPFDKETDTPEGAKVSPDGVTLDSDKDGNPDYLDPEPYSQFNTAVDTTTGITPVNEQGVPLYIVDFIDQKLKDCCEKKIIYQEGNGLKEIMDATKKPDEKKEKLWGIVQQPTTSSVQSMGLWALPTIHFDLNRDEIKPEMFDELLYIATVLRNNPQLVLSVNGHTDIRFTDTYNEGLGLRRAKTAREHLIKNYGLDPNRLQINSFGERKNLIPTAKTEIEHYMNRRVEFYVGVPK
ncbi:MAG: hypothetical protein A3G23_10330 [Bacteroidetes bacterium RIFCSPLOWO2_12_FULL_37_12]|nr:MAG: hypothetical protein A3G23_10330 [Bacteroidetes bacterium RIFCSPLOWO2_12_FULL_37_12]